MNTQIKLGDRVKHKVHVFTGIVIGHVVYLGNVDRYCVQPQVVKDGKPADSDSFDEQNLVFVEHTDHEVTSMVRPADPVALGDIVEDTLTTLRGVVTSIAFWSSGCARVGVQAQTLKEDGTPPPVYYADEKDLRIVERIGARPAQKVKTGGPRPAPTRR